MAASSNSLAGKAESNGGKHCALPRSNFTWRPDENFLRARNFESTPNRKSLPARRLSPARVSPCLGGKESRLAGDARGLAGKENRLAANWGRLARKQFLLVERCGPLAGKDWGFDVEVRCRGSIRLRILYWGDSPAVATGFGVLARPVLGAASGPGPWRRRRRARRNAFPVVTNAIAFALRVVVTAEIGGGRRAHG